MATSKITIPRLLTAKSFPALKPLRFPDAITPAYGTFHWHLTDVNKYQESKTWFPFKADNDILISSFPKCGHHFTQKICLETIKANHNGKYCPELYGTADMGINTTPFIEFYVSQASRSDIEERIRLTNDMYPRIWFTHHLFEDMPLQSMPENGKIIIMIRNPKDAILSNMHFTNRLGKHLGFSETHTEHTLDEFLSYFVRGIWYYGCYFKWYESYWN
eukprot:349793_1